MQQQFELYVENVIQQIDGTYNEKADIKEEMLSHLIQSKEELIEKGNSEEQAIILSLQYFGDAKSVGKGMQEAMFPHRRLFFLLLACTSLFTIFSTYLAALLLNKDAHIAWLLTTVLTSIMLLIFTGNLFPKLERKSLLIGLLIIHTLLFVYGYLIGGQVDHGVSTILSILIIAIIVFSIFLIYRIVLYDYPSPKMIIIHLINMTIGMLVIGTCLFYLWVMLAFFEGTGLFYLLPLIPVIIWLIAYIVQIKLVKRERKLAAFFVLGIICMMAFGLIWIFLR